MEAHFSHGPRKQQPIETNQMGKSKFRVHANKTPKRIDEEFEMTFIGYSIKRASEKRK